MATFNYIYELTTVPPGSTYTLVDSFNPSNKKPAGIQAASDTVSDNGTNQTVTPHTGTVTDAGGTGDRTDTLGDKFADTFTVSGEDNTALNGSYTYSGTATIGGDVVGFVATKDGKTYFFTNNTTYEGKASPTLTLNAVHEGDQNTGGAHQWNLDSQTEVACFMPGTLVATPTGEQPVETLKIGDLVLTAEGQARPVRWMGRHTVSRLFADPQRVLPIRVTAGALGENVPVRDLLVSPDHALLVDGILVQAGALVNGTTIRREANMPMVFTYHHVELADHSLILVEGTPAETFVDNVDRMGFDNWAEHQALYGDLPSIPELPLPRAKAARQVPMAMRHRLAERAALLNRHANAA